MDKINNWKRFNKMLVIAPHPDDEVLGCGGTIAKAIKDNVKVDVVYLTSGDSDQKTREKEAIQVCKYLGINNYYFLRLEKNNFNVSAQAIKTVEETLSKINPDVVFVNHDQDADNEHRIAYQLVIEAYWRYSIKQKNNLTQNLILYEIHKPLQNYNLTEDITNEIDIKVKAMSMYRSQIKQSRLDLAIKGLNQYRGIFHGHCGFAEVFQIKRMQSLFT